jgi:hypothetical protein
VCAERLHDRRCDEPGVDEISKRHPEDTVLDCSDHFGGDLKREPGLPGATRPRDGDKSDLAQETLQLGRLTFTAQQRARRDGEVGRVQRPQRREVVRAKLKQLLRFAHVFEPVPTEVDDDVLSVEQRTCPLGKQHLPTMTGTHDSSRPVHIHPDVAFLCNQGFAGMDSDPYAHRRRRQRRTTFGRSRNRIQRARESDEECVALRIDLHAVVAHKRLTKYEPMLGQQPGIAIAKFLQ